MTILMVYQKPGATLRQQFMPFPVFPTFAHHPSWDVVYFSYSSGCLFCMHVIRTLVEPPHLYLDVSLRLQPRWRCHVGVIVKKEKRSTPYILLKTSTFDFCSDDVVVPLLQDRSILCSSVILFIIMLLHKILLPPWQTNICKINWETHASNMLMAARSPSNLCRATASVKQILLFCPFLHYYKYRISY